MKVGNIADVKVGYIEDVKVGYIEDVKVGYIEDVKVGILGNIGLLIDGSLSLSLAIFLKSLSTASIHSFFWWFHVHYLGTDNNLHSSSLGPNHSSLPVFTLPETSTTPTALHVQSFGKKAFNISLQSFRILFVD